ncbi:MAG: hypothetical protein MJ010_04790 [Paludibacteraceae bacterium]|nr:hypothetical protein [Paludibacteraceae bacterium]
MEKLTKQEHLNGLLALSPVLLFEILFFGFMLMSGEFSDVPVLLCFVLASMYAVLLMRRLPIDERINVFAAEMGRNDIIQVILILIFAGGFASLTEKAGCLDAAIQFSLSVFPARFVFVSIFVATCVLSFSIGSAMGCVVAIAPIAVPLARMYGLDEAILSAAVVGGSMFGDNLSIISDTSIAASRYTGCTPKDKFQHNWPVAVPAALITALIYLLIGLNVTGAETVAKPFDWVMLMPYAVVVITAICGMNVLLVLLLGAFVALGIGCWQGAFTVTGGTRIWSDGLTASGGFCLFILMAAGLVAIIQRIGGISYVSRLIEQEVHSRKGANIATAIASGLLTSGIAVNTVAIIATSSIGVRFADKYGISRGKIASILDMSSCCVQGILPYGMHLIAVAALASINPLRIVPWMLYPFILFIGVIIYCFLPERTNKKFASVKKD